MTTLLIAIVGSQALFSFVQFLIIRHDQKSTPQSEALLAILRDRLLHLCTKYLAEGNITFKEAESFERLYQAYERLGGNSFISELHEKVRALPVIETR